MKNKMIFLMTIVIAAGFLFLMLFEYGQDRKTNDIELVVREFLTALAGQNYEVAQDNADGQVLYTLKSREKQKSSQIAVIRDITPKIVAQSERWATVFAEIEASLGNGVTDITWYRLEMQKTDKWRIYNAELTGPDLSGKSKKNNSSDVDNAKTTFTAYTESIINKKWDKAATYLVGPAKRSHETGAEILNNSPVLEQIKGLELAPIWYNNNILLCEARYKADDRNVKVVITFVQLTDGQWKIVNIKPA